WVVNIITSIRPRRASSSQRREVLSFILSIVEKWSGVCRTAFFMPTTARQTSIDVTREENTFSAMSLSDCHNLMSYGIAPYQLCQITLHLCYCSAARSKHLHPRYYVSNTLTSSASS